MAGSPSAFRRRLDHAERMQIGIEDRILFHAFLLVLLAQRNDLLEDLGVEALYPCTTSMLLLKIEHPPTRRIPYSFFRMHAGTSVSSRWRRAGMLSFERTKNCGRRPTFRPRSGHWTRP